MKHVDKIALTIGDQMGLMDYIWNRRRPKNPNGEGGRTVAWAMELLACPSFSTGNGRLAGYGNGDGDGAPLRLQSPCSPPSVQLLLLCSWGSIRGSMGESSEAGKKDHVGPISGFP